MLTSTIDKFKSMIFKTIKSSINDISIVGSTLTEIGKLNLDATNISGYTTALKGLSTQQAQLVMSTKGLTTAQQQAVLSQISLANATGTLTTSQMTSALITETRNEVDAKALLLNTGLISSETAEATATNTVTAAKLRELVTTGKLTQAEAQLLATKSGITLANQKEASSFAMLGGKLKNVGNSLLALGKAHPLLSLLTLAATLFGIAITIAEKKNEKFIESQEKLIEKIDENISKYDEEISSLDNLQKKLQDAKGNKEALASIQNELNQAIGDTPGLLNKESNAYDIANQKIDDRIRRLKELRKSELNNKITAQKEIFKNSTVDNAWGIDHKFDYFSKHQIMVDDTFGAYEYADYVDKELSKRFATVQEIYDNLKKNNYGNGKKSNAEIWNEIIDSYGGAMLDDLEIQDFFDNQTSVAQKIFEEYINNSESIFSQEELNSIISHLVENGYAQNLEGIQSVITSLVENDELENTINDYYESLYNDDIDSELLYQNIKTQFDELINNYPALKEILENYFNNIGKDIETNINNAVSKDNKITVLSGISETIDNLDKKVKPVMDSLKSAYQDIFTEDGFTLDNVGVDMLNSVKESIAEINEIEGIDIATSSFEDFARVLTNAETTEEQAHQAFNDLVSDIITGTDSTLVSSEAFNTLVQSLEEMGVTNAEEVIRSISNMNDNLNRLANDAESDVSKVNSLLTGMGKDAVTSSNKLTECTWEEIGALTTASKTYGFATDKIQEYVAQKIWSNQNAIDASNDIGQILVVAKSFGIATEAIARYEQVKKLADQGWGGGQAQAEALAKSAYKEILEEIKTLYNFELPTPDYKAPDSKNSSSSKDSSTSFDWIETSLSNMEDILDDLDNKVADTYAKWEDRNKDLADSILKTKEAIELQRDAAKAYEDEANSIGLSSHYKTLVQKGALDIETIKDKDLADRISNYQDLYEKSIECEKKALELERTLNELSSNDKWDLFKSKSDLQIEGADNIIDYQQSLVDKAELQGLFANEDYYKVMRMQNLRKQSELKKQYAELETILNTVPKGTEAYDTLFNEWMDIRNQLGELENEFIEFNNNIRDLDWEIFEYLEDSISRITEEVDFLKDLLSDEDMFDEYGNMTKYADATMGLHFTNIETYKKLAEDYYGEMQELQQQLADGAGQDVLEKYREYEDLHRDAITSIMDEKNAILDLVQNAYDEQINALERINDLTLERMDRERDLYNYQKNIAEKMKEKTSLERQISVYDGDDSEESKANTQRLKLELEKVNSDIEELQYEKQRADTEQMLTSITDSMKEWQSKRMDDEQGLLEEIKDGISTKSDEIKTTLTEVAGEYGTTLSTSLSDIFDKKNPFDNVVTAINNLIDKITGLVGGDSNSDKSSNTPTDNPKPNTNTDVKQPTTNSKQPSQPIDTQSKSETDSIFIPQKSVYPKDKLDKERSIEDRLKYYDYASDFSSRAIYYKKLGGSGAYTGSGTQNSWLLKKMKEVGYASGTNYAKAGLHWTQENGDELIIRKSDGALLTPLSMGDKVVNADGTSNLFTFANDPSGFLAKMGLNYAMPAVNVKLPDVPPLVNRTTQNTPQFHDVNMTFELPNVKSADDFINELQHSSRFEKIVQSMTLGRALGGNSMNKYKF